MTADIRAAVTNVDRLAYRVRMDIEDTPNTCY